MQTGNIIGGAETNLLNILRYAMGGGFEPAAVLMPNEGPLASRIRKLGIPVHLIRYYGLRLPNALRYFQTLWSLRKAVAISKPDVIHLNHQWLAEYAVMAGWMSRCPVVCHLRGVLEDERAPYLGWLTRANAVVCCSHATERSALRHGVPAANVHLVYDGIDLEMFAQAGPGGSLRKMLAISHSTRLVGFVSRVAREKGIEEFIHAARMILLADPEVHFVVVGDDGCQGTYLEGVRQQVERLGLDGAIHFIGFRDDIPAILRDLDVFVLPTWNEAFPNSILEALACGVPVVATSVGGIPEIITDGENGFLVPKQDTFALAEKIRHVLDLTLTERMRISAAGQARVRSQFTIENQVRRLGALYRALLTKRGRKVMPR
jgi:glycosyltransferase involved in cell wall biosynthesis